MYILTNEHNRVLYTGVTSNLAKRIEQHRTGAVKGFSRRYNLSKLVYFEVLESSYAAISREKKIKGGSRQKKLDLINGMNPKWKDLAGGL